jgi:hypothetical protein
MSYKILDAAGKPVQREGRELQGSDLLESIITKEIIDQEQRIVETIVSSDRQDRDGDIVNQKGINHKFSRVVLFAHEHRQLPIGKILSFVIKEKKENGKSYLVTAEKHQFNPKGTYEVSDAAWKMVEFGSLNATSIGFIPTKILRANSEQERQVLGLGPYGIYFDAIEKIETSWVPVPSNRDAIREMFAKGILSRTDVNCLFPRTWNEINKPKYWQIRADFLRDPRITAKTLKLDLDEFGKRLANIQRGLDNLCSLLAEHDIVIDQD